MTTNTPQIINVAFNGSCLQGDVPGGWSRYTRSLIEHLQNGYKDNLRISVFENTQKINHSRWEQLELPALCEKNSVDILHAPANGGLPIAGNFLKVLTVHDLFSEQDFQWKLTLADLKKSLRYKLDWWASLLATDALITVSQFSKNELLAYGVKKPIYLTYEGVALQKPESSAKPRAEPYLLYVGSFDGRKRTADLIQAFLATENNYRLILVGKGAMAQAAIFPSPRLIFRENISDNELSNYYSNATAFITFAVAEGFGLPLAEALSFGCPVLYIGGGAIPEIVGEGGLRVSNTTLNESISKLQAEPQFLSALQHKARLQGLKFDWQKTAEETFAIYKTLLSSKVKS